MQKIRRILAFLLCMAVVLSNVNPMGVFVTPVQAAEEGSETATLDGEGTQESPWLISDAEDFVLMSSLIDSDAAYADDYYQMTNDVDFTDVTMIPVGKTNYFSGVFDGQLHTVKNLTITDTTDHAGLFSYVKGGTIKNLGITESNITSSGWRTGALAGSALNSVIMNCYCDDTVTVNGNSDVGGILGALGSSQMYNCYSAATVSATNIGGGLAGAVNTSENTSNPSKMDNVYSVAKVTGAKQGIITGGLENQSRYPAHLTNVYYCSDLNAIGDGKTPATNGVTKLTEAQVTDGTLLNYLNENLTDTYAEWIADENDYPEPVSFKSELKIALLEYVNAQIATVNASTYYYDAYWDLINKLNEKITVLNQTVEVDLPTLEELTIEIEALLESHADDKPIANEEYLVSEGKTVTAYNLNDAIVHPVTQLNDGNVSSSNYLDILIGTDDDHGYAQIDLGHVMELQELWAVCYNSDARYYQYDLYTSIDGTAFELLENKDDTTNETTAGNWFDAKGVSARYVRIVGIKSSKYNNLHVKELKIYATELWAYRSSRIDEISAYMNDELLFTEEDRTSQLEALDKAVADICDAEDKETIDTIANEYLAFVDSLEMMGTYEIIPSPHSISYDNKYYPYYSAVNVVRVDGSLDKETIAYINEIFGSENVTFAAEKDDAKLNLYLTSDDKDDAVETWIRETYGDQVNAETLAESEAHVIFADENGISIIGNDAEGLFRGLTTIKFIKEQMEANPKGYRGFVINDYADMAFRGLIEGYYGFPWSWEEKAELLDFGADFKMNKLVYAPKNDPYHLANWKDLYPDESEDPENNIQNVAKAAETARKYKADLVWTAHCFGYTCYDQGGYAASCGENGIRYKEGDENIPGSDINLLKAKFQQLYDVGVRTFGLLLDDCDYGPRTLNTPWPEIYNNDEALTEEVLAETTAIVNIMADWCAEKGDCYDLIFCPASYNLNWMKNSYTRMYTQAYQYQEVSYYDIHFRDNVQIITTGTGTFSDTNQSVADRFKTEGVSAATGYADGEERRAPLQWTNYPTVDNGVTLDFGPQYNLRTDLNPDDMYGVMSNPFEWAQFNKTVIPSICQYTWNLKDYDAEEVYEAQMKYVMDTDELAEAMKVFVEHNDKKPFAEGNGEGTQELQDAIAAFKAEISKENADAVLAEINKIVEACEILLTEEKYTTTGMYEQLYPYANALKDLATCIQDYMNMFGENSNVVAYMYDAKTMYERHTSYSFPDVSGTTRYTSTGTLTLKPFADWLRTNETTVMLAADPEVETELELRDSLDSYFDEVIANLAFYYGYETEKQELIAELNAYYDSLKTVSYEELPTLDAFKAQIEVLIASYKEYMPVKNENNLVSQGKTATGYLLNNESVHPITQVNDGDVTANNYVDFGIGTEDDHGYVQIDLGEVMNLQEIWVVCYNSDSRYYQYELYTSTDGTNFELLAEKNDINYETAIGNWFKAEDVSARYVRIVGIKNSKNNNFHVKEMKVYVTGADYTAVDEAIAKAEALVRENYTSQEALEAVDAAVAAVVRGKDANEQDAVDAMAQAINDAIAALELKTAGTFEDVYASDYYYDAVLWSVENGITSGMTATTFEPGASCTRAQAVTFLWRAAGCPEPSTLETAFIDISSKDYYYDAVLWAVENGITAGLTPTAFGPKATCTREQIVTLLWREAGKPEPSALDTTFTDVDPDEYYYSAVLWAVENGITEGLTSTTFGPEGICTRGEIVTFLYRANAI